MKAKPYNDRMHYCPDCNREFHWLGWPRHRAMHRDRKVMAPTTQDLRDTEDLKQMRRSFASQPNQPSAKKALQ